MTVVWSLHGQMGGVEVDNGKCELYIISALNHLESEDDFETGI